MSTVLKFTAESDVELKPLAVPRDRPDVKTQLDWYREMHMATIIDERAKFTFEQAIEWNYTILETRAHLVPPSSPVYEQIRTAFILKNPWEAAFFMSTDLEMFHLQRMAVVCAGELRPPR